MLSINVLVLLFIREGRKIWGMKYRCCITEFSGESSSKKLKIELQLFNFRRSMLKSPSKKCFLTILQIIFGGEALGNLTFSQQKPHGTRKRDDTKGTLQVLFLCAIKQMAFVVDICNIRPPTFKCLLHPTFNISGIRSWICVRLVSSFFCDHLHYSQNQS